MSKLFDFRDLDDGVEITTRQPMNLGAMRGVVASMLTTDEGTAELEENQLVGYGDDMDLEEIYEMTFFNVESYLGYPPNPFLYKLNTKADGTMKYTFFTHHGVGDDECGILLWDLMTLLGSPSILVASGVDELLLVKTDRAIRTEDLLGGVEEDAASSREEDTAVAEESESRTTEEALMLMEKLAGILKAEITIGVRPDGVTWFAASKSTRDDTEIEGPIGETVPALIMHHKEAARIRKEGI